MATYQAAYPAANPTAVVGKRIVAVIIDSLIGAVVYAIVFFGIFADSAPTRGFDLCGTARDVGDAPVLCFNLGDKAYATEGGDSIVVLLATFGISLVNAVVLQGATGASIGKHLLGLRVVDKNTFGNAGMGKCFVRWLVGVVDIIPCCFPLVGLILVLATKNHQRLGDMAGGTFVVGKDSAGQAPPAPGIGAYGAPVGGPAAGGPAPQGAAPGWPPAAPTPASPPPGQWGTPPAAPPTAAWPTPPVETPAWPTPPATDHPTVIQSGPGMPEPEPTAAQPAADATQPQWDAARGAYIQWDPNSNQWVQWDDTAKQWRPIS